MPSVLNDLLKRDMIPKTPEEALMIEADRQRGLNALPMDESINAYPENPNYNPENAAFLKNQGTPEEMGMQLDTSPARKISMSMPEEEVEGVRADPASYAELYKPGSEDRVKGIGLKPVPEFPMSPEEEAAKARGSLGPFKAPTRQPAAKSVIPDEKPIVEGSEPPPVQLSVMDKLMEALQDRREDQLRQGFLKAGAEAANALAGHGYTKTNTAAIDAFDPLIGDQLQDLKETAEMTNVQQKLESQGIGLQNEKTSNDPKSKFSEISRAAVVEALTNAGLDDQAAKIQSNPNISHKQLQDLYGKLNLSNMLTNYQSQQAKLAAAKVKAEGDKKKAEKKETDDSFKREAILRKEVDNFNKQTNYTSLSTNMKNLEERLKSGKFSGVDDVSAVYTMIKALDPGSVVRESEVGMILQASPYLQKIANVPATITKGDVLSPSFRKTLLNSMRNLKAAREAEFNQLTERVNNSVLQYGLNPDNIMIEMKDKPKKAGMSPEEQKELEQLRAKKAALQKESN